MIISDFVKHFSSKLPEELLPPSKELENIVKNFLANHHFHEKIRLITEDLLQNYVPKLPDPISSLKKLNFLIDQHSEKKFDSLLENKKSYQQLLAIPNLSNALFFSLNKYPELLLTSLPVTSLSLNSFDAFLNKSFQVLAKKKQANENWYKIFRKLKIIAFTHILIADFFDIDDFKLTTQKISIFADTCLHLACNVIGLDENKVSIVAMGKLGGFELNYSSDIDLLFLGSNSIKADERQQLEKILQKIIDLIGGNKEDGVIFRVDNQIRPEGSSAGLLMTLKQYQIYYQKRAMNWEKQSLIKARPITGSKSLQQAFEDLKEEVIYSQTTSTKNILLDINKMKRKIEDQLIVRQTNWGNIKLGAGGIRDVEFLVQFLQIHNGKNMQQLRVAGTIESLKQLAHFQIISDEEHEKLRESYIFLRKIEHFLQVKEFLPIRQLPQKENREIIILSRKMRLPSSDIFNLKYSEVTLYIKAVFRDVFEKTAIYIKKIRNIQKELKRMSPSVANVLEKIESDYFLKFSEKKIMEHAHLIHEHLKSNHCQIRQIRNGESINLTLVAQDHLGAFAKICGLVSSWGLLINSGESYICQENNSNQYYRRPQKNYKYSLNQQKKLILCILDCKPSPYSISVNVCIPSPKELTSIAYSFLDEKTKEKESEDWERIVLKLFENQEKLDNETPISPIQFRFDNEIDPTYTLLEIYSQDSFSFLFQFMTSLSSRGYYLGKIELSTIEGRVHDKLYLTTAHGKKIDQADQLIQLKATISLMKTFTHYLREAANPKIALKQFNLLIDMWTKLVFANSTNQSRMLKHLAKILGSSEVWQDLIRLNFDDLSPMITEVDQLRCKSRDELIEEFTETLKKVADENLEKQIEAFNQSKDREMFRIDLHFLAHPDKQFNEFAREISQLADVTVSEAFKIAKNWTKKKKGAEPGQCAIFALGKWGGLEMGYASDLEIIWVYDSSSPQAQAWYLHALQLFRNIIKAKKDGIFEMDFRLRPDGESGSLVITLNRFKKYYTAKGEAHPFERQSLIRLRYCTGDVFIRDEVTQHTKSFVYSDHPHDILEMFRLRNRQINDLVKNKDINVKYSPGGLVDAEYLIQTLQLIFGHLYPDIQTSHTYQAAKKLLQHKILNKEEFNLFKEAYILLRSIINCLRVVRGNARDLILPDKTSLEFAYLERRLKNLDLSKEGKFGNFKNAEDTTNHIIKTMKSLHQLFVSTLSKFTKEKKDVTAEPDNKN